MNIYAMLADALCVVHFGYICFVVLGQLAIMVGWPLGWRWIRNPTFRIVHLTMILIVAVEAYVNFECPLTTWELSLRLSAGQLPANFRALDGQFEPQDMSFIGRLVRDVFFFDNSWGDVLTYCYYGFGAMVLATLFLVPPHFRSRRASVEPPNSRGTPAL